jgi:hypothetical protein
VPGSVEKFPKTFTLRVKSSIFNLTFQFEKVEGIRNNPASKNDIFFMNGKKLTKPTYAKTTVSLVNTKKKERKLIFLLSDRSFGCIEMQRAWQLRF